MSWLKKGTKVIITRGTHKGETGNIESHRVSANYEAMYWIRRDKKTARVLSMQFPSQWVKEYSNE